jgi:hypothetical protein
MEWRSVRARTSAETEHIQTLCETPRPSRACREGAARSTYVIGATTEVSQAAAIENCLEQAMHVVELNSTQERDEVRALFPAITSFWLDGQFNGSRWTSTSGCPLVFEWQAGEPDVDASATRCAIQQSFGARTIDCDMLAAVICERNT